MVQALLSLPADETKLRVSVPFWACAGALETTAAAESSAKQSECGLITNPLLLRCCRSDTITDNSITAAVRLVPVVPVSDDSALVGNAGHRIIRDHGTAEHGGAADVNAISVVVELITIERCRYGSGPGKAQEAICAVVTQHTIGNADGCGAAGCLVNFNVNSCSIVGSDNMINGTVGRRGTAQRNIPDPRELVVQQRGLDDLEVDRAAGHRLD